VKSFGELIAGRRKELGLTQTELGQRLIGRLGGPISQERVADIESDRYGVPRRGTLEQLAAVLQLEVDVLYLWGRLIPPDIDPAGVPEEAIRMAWRFFRATLSEGRRLNAERG
jgi:transcriptional regulator with XRE-family HTH domain